VLSFLAWRELRSSPLTAAVLVFAASAGVGFQIPNTANLLGYEAEMFQQGVKCGFGDVRLYLRYGRRIEAAQETAARVRQVEGITGVSSVLILPGAICKGDHSQSVTALAVEAPDGRWPFRLVGGQALAAGDKQGILLGRALAGRLGVGVGDQVAGRPWPQ
jgi:ABC-type lipoprotein release transport system permease subunit